MSEYKVQFFWGDYRERQRKANTAGAICYAEQHFNGGSPSAKGTEVIVSTNSSETSRKWGSLYARTLSNALGLDLRNPPTGVLVGGYKGRGNGNLKYTNMPAVLLEPCFATNPKEASLIKDSTSQLKMAKVLVDSIRIQFPAGGLVAFSVGHKGKTSNPMDRGVQLYGGGYEADYAEIVLKMAAELLDNTGEIEEVHPQGADIDSREQAASLIVGFEARYDEEGRLSVYNLPGGDGGGSYEIAGINDRYHPRAAYKLKQMVGRGEHDSAVDYATEYIAAYTDFVRDWLAPIDLVSSEEHPGVEFFLRDSGFNRGPRGAARILQHALNVTNDGVVGPKTKKALAKALEVGPKELLYSLREAREWYERQYAGRNESSKFWKGLSKRWDKALNLALEMS